MQPLPDPSKNSLSEKVSSSSSESANFVTECFFLTMYGLHMGFAPITANYASLIRELNELQKAYKQLVDASSQGATVRIERIFIIDRPHTLDQSTYHDTSSFDDTFRNMD
jgi:hypothetical protein